MVIAPLLFCRIKLSSDMICHAVILPCLIELTMHHAKVTISYLIHIIFSYQLSVLLKEVGDIIGNETKRCRSSLINYID